MYYTTCRRMYELEIYCYLYSEFYCSLDYTWLYSIDRLEWLTGLKRKLKRKRNTGHLTYIHIYFVIIASLRRDSMMTRKLVKLAQFFFFVIIIPNTRIRFTNRNDKQFKKKKESHENCVEKK